MSLKNHLERLGGTLKHGAATMRRLTHRPIVLLDVPSRMQMDGYCCGLCSARMVAEFHGIHIPHAKVEQFAGENRDGTNTEPMTAFLRANGLRVRTYAEGEAHVKGAPKVQRVPVQK